MTPAIRALLVASLALSSSAVFSGAAPGQAQSVLRIKVTVAATDGTATPVARHVLFVSDNPATGLPRRVVTGADGTVDVRLRPGSYMVESDRPVAFQGKGYQWMQIVDVAAGRDTVLDLTAGNADVEAATAEMATAGAPPAANPAADPIQWQNSIVAIWTPLARTSGFLIDTRGLIASDERSIGAATAIEVQLTPALKVAAAVLATDAGRDVAILRINPKVAASMRPVPLGCVASDKTPAREDRVAPAAGSPIRIEDVCAVLPLAEKKMTDAAPPESPLPVEPAAPIPVDVLDAAAARRAGGLSPYKMSASDFEIAFITPVLTWGARHPPESAKGRERTAPPRGADEEPAFLRPLLDFANWTDYVAERQAVLLIRVTPKLGESFWTTFGRMAARTQGVSIPPIKHFKADFGRMRILCGETEVAPIHPFVLEHQISEKESLHEGLYVLDPDAIGSRCSSPITLVLYPVKEPGKGDTRPVDPKLIAQIREDFAAYRPAK